MPAKAQWLLRVPEILAELAALDVPVLDRAVCERLFRLRRRRTIDLIRCFGGYQAGRTFLVDRPKLIAQLEQIRDSPDFKMEACQMPAKAQWLLRVPEILAELTALDVPVVDRAVCERLFRLRRRRRIDLVRCFGGYQAGRTFLVDRPKLVAQLEQIRDSPDFKMEWRRKERLAERLDAIRRLQAGARVAIAVEPETLRQRLPDLPPGVGLSPGELHIQFQSSEELLSKLFALAQAIANDYEAFEKRTSG